MTHDDDVRPFYVNGEWRTGEGTFEVKSPYDDSVVAEIGVPTDADVEEADRGRGRDVRGVPAPAGRTRAPRRSTTSRSACRETVDENAELIAARGRQAAQVGDGRGDPRGLHVPVGVRGDPPRRRRADAPGHRGRRSARGSGCIRRFPIGPVLGHHAVQLPAEPGRAQGRARARGRRADRGQARERHADRGAACWPSSSPRPTCRRACSRCCRSRSKVADGMARDDRLPQDLVHRVRRDRLVPEGPRPEEARDARARRQRRRDRALATPTSTSPRSGSRSAGTTRPGRAASACSACSCSPRSTRTSPRGSSKQVEQPEGRRPDGPDRRRRPGDRQRRGRPHRRVGRGGRVRRAPRS